MTYYEERVAKAKALVSYAERGFKKSVVETSGTIATLALSNSIDEIPAQLEHLLLEYEAVKDVREDLERAMKYLEKENENGKD